MSSEEILTIAAAVGDRVAERVESRLTVQPTLTLADAAESLGISCEKLRQLCNDGEIGITRVDKFYRIKPGDINRYLEKHYRPAAN